MSIISKNGLHLIQEKNKVFCDSRELAKQFGKNHPMILKKIEKEIEVFGTLKLTHEIEEFFVKAEYGNRGKKYPRYKLTFEGFQQIALSLTGDDAVLNRYKFIKLFKYLISNIEKDKLVALENSKDSGWLEFRTEGKIYRTKLTDAIKIYIVKYRMEVEEKTNDGRYYQHYTDLINKKIGISLPKGTNPRDVLDTKMLVKLVIMEDKISELITKYANEGIHYKEAFKMIKKEML